MSGKKKIIISLVVGLTFSGIALYYSFKNIPIGDLVAYLATINYWWVIPSVCISLFTFAIRAVRWQLLLSPIKKTHFWNAFHPLMIGFSLNCLVPARMGEVARPVVFSKREKVSFFKVLATVGAERVLDLVVLLLFFIIVLTTVDMAPDLERSFGGYRLNKATLEKIGATTAKVAFVLILGIVSLCVKASRGWISRMIMRCPNLLLFAGPSFREKVREKVCQKLVVIIDNVAIGFDLLKNPFRLLQCLALSFLVWAFSAVAYYVLSFGCPGVDVSFLEMSATMVIVCFFISLPSVPGFWGLWEAGGIFALLVFGVPRQEAAGFTLTNHVVQVVPLIIVGLISAAVVGIRFLHVAYGSGLEDKAPLSDSRPGR